MKILTLFVICIAAMAAANANAASRTPGAALDKADANHDGYLTREEFKASRAVQFERLDRNNDGLVTLSEFPRLAKSSRPKAKALKTMITHADHDGDGRVTRAEFVDGPALLFDRADRDHDGRLSSEEVAAVREQLDSLQ
jgi:Ca2+-binding EF-hand superfamily protein